MSIPTVTNSVLSYFHRFDLSSIARTRDGRLVATKDPTGYESAWWMRAADVGPVLARARADHADVPAAAVALRVKAIEHSAAVQRAEELVARLDARLKSAQQSGALRQFNVAYGRYRRARLDAGEPAMGYSAARARLRKAMVEAAAGKASPGFVRRVFHDRPPDPR
jgi:hypothetical protein